MVFQVSPYTTELDNDDDEWDTSKGLRVMGVAYVPDLSQAAFACLIAPDGECTDYIRLPNLLRWKTSMNKADSKMKEADLNALKGLIQNKKPHVIVVGGESRDALMVKQDIQQIVTSLVEDEEFASVSVEILDNELAKTFANSLKGEVCIFTVDIRKRKAINLSTICTCVVPSHLNLLSLPLVRLSNCCILKCHNIFNI